MVARTDHEKSARILTAAEELVLKRGFKGVTIAEIAEKAHVGKGTLYLYWSTKEDLFLAVLVRNLVAVLDEHIDATTADPDLALPHRLFPRLVRSVLQRPLARALQTDDAELLGALADHPRSRELVRAQGAPAIIEALIPVWRRHGLARTDWEPEAQAYALQTLTVGYLQTTIRQHLLGNDQDSDSRDDIVAAAVQALLDEHDLAPAAIRTAADETLQVLRASREALVASA